MPATSKGFVPDSIRSETVVASAGLSGAAVFASLWAELPQPAAMTSVEALIRTAAKSRNQTCIRFPTLLFISIHPFLLILSLIGRKDTAECYEAATRK